MSETLSSSSKHSNAEKPIKPSSSKQNNAKDLSYSISADLRISQHSVTNVINLLDQDNTVPFIARYRRHCTGGLEAQSIREIKEHYDALKAVKEKAMKLLNKLGDKVSPIIKQSFLEAKTMQELDEMYAPFKKDGKGTLAERARKAGLDEIAQRVLQRSMEKCYCENMVADKIQGRATLAEVYTGIQYIIADIISKDVRTREEFTQMAAYSTYLKSTYTKDGEQLDTEKKFHLYSNMETTVKSLKPHQTLAINRGEQLKILSVKLTVAKKVVDHFLQWCERRWILRNTTAENRSIISKSIRDAYTRLIEKRHCRSIRAELTKTAERSAIHIFIQNLKSLLLSPPVKNKVVLAIDPGYSHGCKCAALGINGDVLETKTIYPSRNRKEAEEDLRRLVQQHKCTVIALGNGTACREIESFLVSLLRRKAFEPLDVVYSIVDEAGASVYSVTEEAGQELPGLDVNLRSAVSIGRRLQDPLLELVKIDPKSLGVGMYQHDLPDVLMRGALEGTLEDCVSFVGIDLNACSAGLLSRVAGMSKKKAASIVEWREKQGPFINRKQLLKIKGIGEKTFEQAAGFIRIKPRKVQGPNVNEIPSENEKPQGRKRKANDGKQSAAKRMKIVETYGVEPLDQTWIHPESYNIAYNFLKHVKGTVDMIGTTELRKKISEHVAKDLDGLIRSLNTDKDTLLMIADGLKQPKFYDVRSELAEPLFRKDITKYEDLRCGDKLTGKVKNITTFGAFVDCGCHKDGLIHISNWGNVKDLSPGDRVECEVISIDMQRSRLALRLISRQSMELNLL